MHFHLPKPLHGWREFAGEVGIIVIGVLIALGAEQVVEETSWQHKVSVTNDELKAEVYGSAVNMAERIAVQPCLRAQIGALAAQLNTAGTSWKGLPVVLSREAMLKNGGEGPVLATAYRPPSRLWLEDRWKAAAADGTLSHFNSARAQSYAIFYRGIEQLNELQATEAQAASKLAYLAADRQLSPDQRPAFFAALAEVDRVNSLMALASAQGLSGLASMRLHFDQRQELRDARETTMYEQALRGHCVMPLRIALN